MTNTVFWRIQQQHSNIDSNIVSLPFGAGLVVYGGFITPSQVGAEKTHPSRTIS